MGNRLDFAVEKSSLVEQNQNAHTKIFLVEGSIFYRQPTKHLWLDKTAQVFNLQYMCGFPILRLNIRYALHFYRVMWEIHRVH
jgi:hypothetical protein